MDPNSPRARAEREEREAAERKAAEREQRRLAEAEHARRTAEAAVFEAQARALPDSKFTDDPSVIPLREAAASAKRRLDALSRFAGAEALRSSVARLKAETAAGTCRANLEMAAIEDALAGDLRFTRYADVQRRIADSRLQLEAAEVALRALVQDGPRTRTALTMHAREAANAAADALLELKRLHLRAANARACESASAPDWTRIEALYRGGDLSVREIAARQGISEGAIRKRAKRDAWHREDGDQSTEAPAGNDYEGRLRAIADQVGP